MFQSNWRKLNGPSLETANVTLKSFGPVGPLEISRCWKMLLFVVCVVVLLSSSLRDYSIYAEFSYCMTVFAALRYLDQ